MRQHVGYVGLSLQDKHTDDAQELLSMQPQSNERVAQDFHSPIRISISCVSRKCRDPAVPFLQRA